MESDKLRRQICFLPKPGAKQSAVQQSETNEEFPAVVSMIQLCAGTVNSLMAKGSGSPYLSIRGGARTAIMRRPSVTAAGT